MDKLAVGPGVPDGVVDLDQDPADNVRAYAQARGVTTKQVTVCILERPRHDELIEKVRGTDASIRLISDGDVAGVIHCAQSDATGIDMYMGSGGAPEGVLAAAALKSHGRGRSRGACCSAKTRSASGRGAPASRTSIANTRSTTWSGAM